MNSAANNVAWNSLEMVFTGKLDSVKRGPVGRSMPPMYTATLTFTVEQVIRGDLKAGDEIVLSHVARQRKAPVFPEGKLCLIGAKTGDHDRLIAVQIEKAGDDLVKKVAGLCKLPLGWKALANGDLVSPWAELDGAWPKELGNLGAESTCSKSGRPTLMCGAGVAVSLKPVPPPKEIKWTNPDGDGDYEITVKNLTAKPVTIPALLTDGKDICWANSVIIICQKTAYPAPGYRTGIAQLEPVTLKPGESVSGVINPLALDGPDWPRGGYRISFQFCLGEKSVSHSFYYMSRHHDKIREALKTAE